MSTACAPPGGPSTAPDTEPVPAWENNAAGAATSGEPTTAVGLDTSLPSSIGQYPTGAGDTRVIARYSAERSGFTPRPRRRSTPAPEMSVQASPRSAVTGSRVRRGAQSAASQRSRSSPSTATARGVLRPAAPYRGLAGLFGL